MIMATEYRFQERLNIQQIREFLLHGTEVMEISSECYQERVENARRAVDQLLKNAFIKEEDYDKAMGVVYDYANAIEEVFMEIGLQSGACIVAQLLANKLMETDK